MSDRTNTNYLFDSEYEITDNSCYFNLSLHWVDETGVEMLENIFRDTANLSNNQQCIYKNDLLKISGELQITDANIEKNASIKILVKGFYFDNNEQKYLNNNILLFSGLTGDLINKKIPIKKYIQANQLLEQIAEQLTEQEKIKIFFELRFICDLFPTPKVFTHYHEEQYNEENNGDEAIEIIPNIYVIYNYEENRPNLDNNITFSYDKNTHLLHIAANSTGILKLSLQYNEIINSLGWSSIIDDTDPPGLKHYSKDEVIDINPKYTIIQIFVTSENNVSKYIIKHTALNIHLPDLSTGGVAFGQLSNSIENYPMFECNYPSYFMKPVYFFDRLYFNNEEQRFGYYPGDSLDLTETNWPGFISGNREQIKASINLGMPIFSSNINIIGTFRIHTNDHLLDWPIQGSSGPNGSASLWIVGNVIEIIINPIKYTGIVNIIIQRTDGGNLTDNTNLSNTNITIRGVKEGALTPFTITFN